MWRRRRKGIQGEICTYNLCNNHSLISNREKEREEEDKKEKWKNVSRTTATMNAKKAPQWTMNLV